MNILHVIPSLDPLDGGPPVVALALASAQTALGHQADLLAYQSSDSLARVQAMVRQVPGATAVRLSLVECPGRFERFTAQRASIVAWQSVQSCDWIHLHGVWSPLLKRVASLATKAGKPYAIMPHGMLDPWSLAQRRFKKRLALMMGFGAMINRARFIHVLNDDEARLLNPLRLSPPGVVIPNGVFPDEINRVVKPGCFRTNYPVVGTRAYILFLGRLHFKKGLDYLVDAFRIVHEARPDVHLILAGSDFGYQADCQTRIDRLGLRPHVSFVGPLLGDDKLDAIRGAVCFCLPSRQEGFSIAILEALASGIPVVISDACHFPEVAEVGAGIVTPLRAEAVADALIRVLQHPTPRQTFGDAGRSLVDQRYTWPRIAEQTIGAYRGHSADPIGPVN